MEELLKTSLHAYLSSEMFFGIWVVLFSAIIIVKTKNMESRKLKIALRIIICSVLTGLWAFFCVYKSLYPISLAYYEYQNNLVEEKVGVIESIEQDGKDRILISIDGTIYTMVYSSLKPYNHVTIDIVKGDTVWVLTGEHSLYIFDICEMGD